MTRFLTAAAVAGALLLSASGASAHHSPTAVFDIGRTIKQTGTLSKIQFINPHILVLVDVKDRAGKVTTWTFEGHPPSWFRRAGLGRKDLEKGMGQTVTVEGMPARSGKPFAYFKQITFKDGSFLRFAESEDEKSGR